MILIGAAVLIIFEFVVRLRRLRAIRSHVLIEQHRNTSGVEIAASRECSPSSDDDAAADYR